LLINGESPKDFSLEDVREMLKNAEEKNQTTPEEEYKRLQESLVIIPEDLHQSVFTINVVMRQFLDKYPGIVVLEILGMALKNRLKDFCDRFCKLFHNKPAESANLPPFDEGVDLSAQKVSYYEGFQKAWESPKNAAGRELPEASTQKRKRLFEICDKSADQSGCLNELRNYLEQIEKELVVDCYKPGVNGQLCLNLALQKLGMQQEDLIAWIAEASQS